MACGVQLGCVPAGGDSLKALGLSRVVFLKVVQAVGSSLVVFSGFKDQFISLTCRW